MAQKKSKRTLTPTLRFPEFRDGEGWQTQQLSDLYGFKRTNTLSRDKLNYEGGPIRNIHYGDIHTKFKPLFRVDQEYVPFINSEVSVDAFKEEDDCEEGDIVLADASEDLTDVGKAIEVVSLHGQRVVAGTHTILATRHGSVPIVGFGGHLFQSAAVRAGIQRESQGAKVYGISANRISPVPLSLPTTNQEQQKIADCLSSLDELIAADSRILEALKAHKKGLMQQLFPQPGETQPRLRFPEFRGRGEWVEKLLGDVGKVSMCKRIMKHETSESGDIPFYKIGTFGKQADAYISKEIYDEYRKKYSFPKKGDILISASGTIGRTVVYDGKPAYFQDSNIVWIANDENIVSNSLLVFVYQTLKWVTDDNTIARLYNDNLRRIKLAIPSLPAEQHRIADCLTSLDTRIAAQATKIDALKQHKRGLMQQLFPSQEGQ